MALTAITLVNSTLGTVDTTNLSHDGTYATLQQGDKVVFTQGINEEYHWSFGATKLLKKVQLYFDYNVTVGGDEGGDSSDDILVYYIPPGKTGETAGVKPDYVLFATFTPATWGTAGYWREDTNYNLYFENPTTVEAEGIYIQWELQDFLIQLDTKTLSVNEAYAWEEPAAGVTGQVIMIMS